MLACLCTVFSIHLLVKHVPGVENIAADALSCNTLPMFFATTLQASPVPTGVPRCLQELVFNQALRWTSPSWKQLFTTTLSTCVAPATRVSYAVAQRRYLTFCRETRVSQPWPVRVTFQASGLLTFFLVWATLSHRNPCFNWSMYSWESRECKLVKHLPHSKDSQL